MPKRKRGPGSNWDKHPQYLHFSASQSAADTTTTTTLSLPKEAFAHPTSPTIIEILAVYFDWDGNFVEDTEDSIIRCFITTRNSGTTATNVSDPSLLAWDTLRTTTLQAVGTTGFFVTANYPKMFDCSPDGTGILVATDNIYIQITNTATLGSVLSCRGKILYRFVKVGLSEYVGILQSQQ